MTSKVNIQEEIWLQVGENQGDEDRTWCEDKINDSDVKYIRADLITKIRLEDCEEVKKMKKYSGKHNASHTWIEDGYCNGCKASLTTMQLRDEFGYNQAIDDMLAKLKEVEK